MIGVLGGTFNPVHFGHLRPAIDVVETLNLRQLIFVPCNIPPHRTLPEVDAQTRLTMLEVALKGQVKLSVDSRELQREGTSYTIDTLQSFREELGEESICLVIGKDALLNFQLWHKWRQIFELAHLVVMHRPGYRVNADTNIVAPTLLTEINNRVTDSVSLLTNKSHGHIYFQTVTQLGISATQVRNLVKQGKNPVFNPTTILNTVRWCP